MCKYYIDGKKMGLRREDAAVPSCRVKKLMGDRIKKMKRTEHGGQMYAMSTKVSLAPIATVPHPWLRASICSNHYHSIAKIIKKRRRRKLTISLNAS